MLFAFRSICQRTTISHKHTSADEEVQSYTYIYTWITTLLCANLFCIYFSWEFVFFSTYFFPFFLFISFVFTICSHILSLLFHVLLSLTKWYSSFFRVFLRAECRMYAKCKCAIHKWSEIASATVFIFVFIMYEKDIIISWVSV